MFKCLHFIFIKNYMLCFNVQCVMLNVMFYFIFLIYIYIYMFKNIFMFKKKTYL